MAYFCNMNPGQSIEDDEKQMCDETICVFSHQKLPAKIMIGAKRLIS